MAALEHVIVNSAGRSVRCSNLHCVRYGNNDAKQGAAFFQPACDAVSVYAKILSTIIGGRGTIDCCVACLVDVMHE